MQHMWFSCYSHLTNKRGTKGEETWNWQKKSGRSIPNATNRMKLPLLACTNSFESSGNTKVTGALRAPGFSRGTLTILMTLLNANTCSATQCKDIPGFRAQMYAETKHVWCNLNMCYFKQTRMRKMTNRHTSCWGFGWFVTIINMGKNWCVDPVLGLGSMRPIWFFHWHKLDVLRSPVAWTLTFMLFMYI